MDIAKVIQEAATWIEKVNKNYEANLYRTPTGLSLPKGDLNIYHENQDSVRLATYKRSTFSEPLNLHNNSATIHMMPREVSIAAVAQSSCC